MTWLTEGREECLAAAAMVVLGWVGCLRACAAIDSSSSISRLGLADCRRHDVGFGPFGGPFQGWGLDEELGVAARGMRVMTEAEAWAISGERDQRGWSWVETDLVDGVEVKLFQTEVDTRR